LLAVRVSTPLPFGAFGTNAGVTPLGRADVTAMLTLPVKPGCGVTVMADVPELPGLIDKLVVEAAS
jgi:hypothetical protein